MLLCPKSLFRGHKDSLDCSPYSLLLIPLRGNWILDLWGITSEFHKPLDEPRHGPYHRCPQHLQDKLDPLLFHWLLSTRPTLKYSATHIPRRLDLFSFDFIGINCFWFGTDGHRTSLGHTNTRSCLVFNTTLKTILEAFNGNAIMADFSNTDLWHFDQDMTVDRVSMIDLLRMIQFTLRISNLCRSLLHSSRRPEDLLSSNINPWSGFDHPSKQRTWTCEPGGAFREGGRGDPCQGTEEDNRGRCYDNERGGSLS